MNIEQFSEQDIAQITETVEKAEKNTSGEICVRIVEYCEPQVHGNAYKQAQVEFERLGMAHTKDKTGVLVLIITKAKKFAIIGDLGIHEKLPPDYWQQMSSFLTLHFEEGKFADGVCKVVEEIGRQLADHFPRKSDDTDELSNAPVIGEQNE